MLDSYKDLIVWQKSIDLVEEIYILTSQFPKEEAYGLSIQMRRAAISIPSNIAEGQRRKDLPEYLHFLRIADASSAELETQIIISKRLFPKLDYSKIDKLLEEIQKTLSVLLKRLNEKNLKPKTQNLKPNAGQSLIEIIIAMAVGGLLIGAAVTTIVPMLKSNLVAKNIQTANSLAQGYIDILKSKTDADWHTLYDLFDKGPASKFYLSATSTAQYEILAGTTSTVSDNQVFNIYFSVENVNRTSCGIGDITSAEASSLCSSPASWPAPTDQVAEDSSTQKITVLVKLENGQEIIRRIQYLSRVRNQVFVQSDWSAGGNQESFPSDATTTYVNNQFTTSTNTDYWSTPGYIRINGF